jgi:hypothetical protein
MRLQLLVICLTPAFVGCGGATPNTGGDLATSGGADMTAAGGGDMAGDMAQQPPPPDLTQSGGDLAPPMGFTDKQCASHGKNTVDCPMGKQYIYQCPISPAPEPSCTQIMKSGPTQGFWCCPDALCNHFGPDVVCKDPSKPHYYNCARDITPSGCALSSMDSNSNWYCCP